MPKAYTKPHLPINDQIALLEGRGMVIDDHGKAAEYLSRLGYYRLSAYWYPFRETIGATVTDNFKPNANFRWAVDLYAFDKSLRLHLLDALERIEVFGRTAVALQLGAIDPLAHRNPANFNRKFTTINPKNGVVPHTKWLAILDEKVRTSKEEFAVHFRKNYSKSHMPIWVAVELLDFGPLSILLSGLKWNDTQTIAAGCQQGLRPDVFSSWIRSLSVVRNVCAHHARLWNKPLVDQPKLPAGGSVPYVDHLANAPFTNRRMYAACVVARTLLMSVNPRSKWHDRFVEHLNSFPTTPYTSIRTMGFPENWAQEAVWK